MFRNLRWSWTPSRDETTTWRNVRCSLERRQRAACLQDVTLHHCTATASDLNVDVWTSQTCGLALMCCYSSSRICVCRRRPAVLRSCFAWDRQKISRL